MCVSSTPLVHIIIATVGFVIIFILIVVLIFVILLCVRDCLSQSL